MLESICQGDQVERDTAPKNSRKTSPVEIPQAAAGPSCQSSRQSSMQVTNLQATIPAVFVAAAGTSHGEASLSRAASQETASKHLLLKKKNLKMMTTIFPGTISKVQKEEK